MLAPVSTVIPKFSHHRPYQGNIQPQQQVSIIDELITVEPPVIRTPWVSLGPDYRGPTVFLIIGYYGFVLFKIIFHSPLLITTHKFN